MGSIRDVVAASLRLEEERRRRRRDAANRAAEAGRNVARELEAALRELVDHRLEMVVHDEGEDVVVFVLGWTDPDDGEHERVVRAFAVAVRDERAVLLDREMADVATFSSEDELRVAVHTLVRPLVAAAMDWVDGRSR